MKRFINNLYIVISAIGIVMLGGCTRDYIFDSYDADGPVSVTMNFGYEPLAEGLGTRSVNGDLDFDIEDLIVLFYAVGEEDSEDTAPVYSFCHKNMATTLADRNGSTTEKKTRQGTCALNGIAPGTYRIYVVANMEALLANKKSDDKYTITEKELREFKIEWGDRYAGNESVSSSKKPSDHKIPDAMFGYVSRDRNRHDVIYHDTALGASTSVNRAETITLTGGNVEVYAWLKRTVSKLTIGFDGSALNEGVKITIKSVHLRDVATSCLLGKDNQPKNETELADCEELQGPIEAAPDAPEGVSEGDESESVQDVRLHIDWTSNTTAITKASPYFPAAATRDAADWKQAVHAQESAALYFFENMQGVTDGTDGKGKKQSSNGTTMDDLKPGEGDGVSDTYYEKDNMPYGTYIEVHADYENAKTKSSGSIIYRFMLGKDVEKDFNAERNHHYKLTMRFIGDANNVDWHIDYTEVVKRIYFPIPTEEQWQQSNVWHAYNDDGEPIAEMAKELVYYQEGTDESTRKYYQIVTVYPVKKDTSKEGDPYQYTTNLDKGMIAQVLACDTDTDEDLTTKAGGTISIYLRTQPSNFTRASSSKGDESIKSLVWGDHENYHYVEVLSDTFNQDVIGKIEMYRTGTSPYYFYTKTDDYKYENKFVYNLKLGDKTDYALRIQAYRVNDACSNSYPVVKIGAAYWLREDLKATCYQSGEPIYEYQPPICEQEGYEEAGCDPECGYDYNFGGAGRGYVNFYERYPMYKIDPKTGIYLYNFFAMTGTCLGADGTYKDCDEVDPCFDIETPGGMYALNQHGFIASKYLASKNYFEGNFDTSEPYDLRDDEMTAKGRHNCQLAPIGWHIPIINGYTLGEFGDIECDHDYLEEYLDDNWERAMINLNGREWPALEGSEIKTRNLSCLSLAAIPVNWECDDAQVTYDVHTATGLNNSTKDLTGVVIPFWGTEVEGYDRYWDVFYTHPLFMTHDTINYKHKVVNKFSHGVTDVICKAATKAYIPLRCVRNAYDYSVQKISKRTN